MKVDILQFLTVTELGPQIVCEFEECKRFAQLLACTLGKPTLANLHMI